MDKLSLITLLELLGLEHCLKDSVFDDEKLEAIFEEPIELHIQPNYPLKCGIAVAKLKNGKPVLAATEASQYGDKDAWDDNYE